MRHYQLSAVVRHYPLSSNFTQCHREERSVRRSDLPFSDEIGHLGNDASACKGRMLVATFAAT